MDTSNVYELTWKDFAVEIYSACKPYGCTKKRAEHLGKCAYHVMFHALYNSGNDCFLRSKIRLDAVLDYVDDTEKNGYMIKYTVWKILDNVYDALNIPANQR